MPTPDPLLGPNAPRIAHAAPEYSGAAAGSAVPISRKRIVFRFWLAAIGIGATIWAGIAYGLGLI